MTNDTELHELLRIESNTREQNDLTLATKGEVLHRQINAIVNRLDGIEDLRMRLDSLTEYLGVLVFPDTTKTWGYSVAPKDNLR